MPMPAQPGTATVSAGLARTWEAVYPGTADQLGRVRTELRPLLRDCPMADDIILLISELAANAITHSDSGQPGGTFTVRVSHHPGGHVRAEIQDGGSRWDGDLARSARPPHGLYLLLTLSAECGTEQRVRSRTTWFRVDYPQHG